MLKPRLVLIAGANGCGKTTLTKQLLDHPWTDGCVFINPDEIAQEKFGGWSEETFQKTQAFCEELRCKLLNQGKSMVLETCFTHEEKLEFVMKAKKLGYFVRLYFIGTDTPVINSGRVCNRMLNGGHEVAISKIIKRHSGVITMSLLSAPVVDRLYVFDNSTEGKPPVELFRVRDGVVVKRSPHLEAHKWGTNMLRTLPDIFKTYNASIHETVTAKDHIEATVVTSAQISESSSAADKSDASIVRAGSCKTV